MKINSNKDSGRSIYNKSKPLQKISQKKKYANDKEWFKDNVDFFASLSNLNIDSFYDDRHDHKRELYDWYNNIIPERYFKYVNNKLNSSNSEYRNFPAKIRPYTLLRSNIDILLGEYRDKPFNYHVKVTNDDAVNLMEKALHQDTVKMLHQMFINELNQYDSVDTGIPSEQVETPEEIETRYRMSYKDERAVQGQAALDYIVEETYMKEKLNDMYKHWSITGEAYSYKEVRHDEVNYEVVSPLEFEFDNNAKYVEDGEWCVRRYFMSLSQIIDKFYNELSGSDIDSLESEYTTAYYLPNLYNQLEDTFDDSNSIEVFHVCWKTYKKIGILTYIDEFTGEEQKIEVDESYRLSKEEKELGFTIKWYWITEVCEGYRLNNANNEIYLQLRVLPYQRNKFNMLSSCKLPYNGRKYSNTHSNNISILKLGIDYQILFIIILYQIELTLAKNKGKILLLDKNVIPNKGNWDEEKFVYWAEALGYGFIDRNQVGADKSFNQYQAIDMSTLAHVSELIQILEYIKKLWDDTIGMSPQRKGNISNSAGLGTTNRAVYQSSIVSQEISHKFDEFVKRDLRGLLDISKFAWREGKKSLHISNNMRNIILSTDENYMFSEFAIFATNTNNEKDKLMNLQQYAQAFAQNGESPLTILEIMKANSLSQVESILNDMEYRQTKKAQQEYESQSQLIEQENQIKVQFEEYKNTFEINKMNAEYDRKERIELIKGQLNQLSFQNTIDANNNGVADSLEFMSQVNDMDSKEKDRMLKREELQSKERIENKKAETALRIAKENKNKYDK